MPAGWRTVRVFISSTFRDMQAERDHLVRFVFPRLREELLGRRIHLVDVDLRWGVTAEQDALSACREIIDECRPRFICILGGRYGWTPPGEERSITADEVHYAALDRLDRDEYRYFYFRDPEATESIPEDAARAGAYREFPTEEDITEHGPERAQELARERTQKREALKQQVRDARLPVFDYPARWDEGRQRLVGLEAFGEAVYRDLLTSIDDEFGEEAPEALDWFAEENAAMEAFIEERTERYVVGSRQALLDEMTAHAEGSGEPSVLVATGEPGSGKSALLGRFYRDYAQAHPDEIVIAHLVGSSQGSTSIRLTLRRLCHELADAAGIEDLGYPVRSGCGKIVLVREDYPGTLSESERRFSTAEACRGYLAARRWPEGFVCPRCRHGHAGPLARGLFQCVACDVQTSVTAGTILGGTRTAQPGGARCRGATACRLRAPTRDAAGEVNARMDTTGKTTLAGLTLLTAIVWCLPCDANSRRANLVANPGFEQGAAGWQERGAAITLDGQVHVSGEHSCRLVGHPGVPQAAFHWVKSSAIPVRPGREYLLEFMVRASIQSGQVNPAVRQADASGTGISYDYAEWLGPGDYDWHQVRFRFVTSPHARQVEVYFIMRDCIGTAWFDDVALHELPGSPLPEIGTGAAVTFPGSPGSLDMRVESVAVEDALIRVRTTGAEYELSCATGVLTGRQRIEAPRDSYVLRIRPTPGPMRLLRSDDSVCVVGNREIEIGFQCDALVVIAPGRDTALSVEGRFGGAWTQNEAGSVQVTDDSGGVGIYPYVLPGVELGSDLEQRPSDLSQVGWRCRYDLSAGTLLGVSIYPPRPFDWQKSFDWQLAHTTLFPPDRALETWSRYVRLVTLHETMWSGEQPVPHTGPYRPLDEEQFRRVIATCDRLGMSVLPYMSPFYYYQAGIDGFLTQLAELRDRYGFHGVFYDGLFFDDWLESYRLMRLTRQMFPDGPIFLHTSAGPPNGNRDLSCPFIDTWADIVLRGEGKETSGPDNTYVRYVAAGYRLSNAIGFMKGHLWDLPEDDQLREMLECNGRARLIVYPTKVDEDQYRWPGEDGTLDTEWTRVYWPLLQQLRAKWQAGELRSAAHDRR